MTPSHRRVMALWIPDWPVHAHLAEHPEAGSPPGQPDAPVALLAARRVSACSAEARAAGVRVGLKEHEARFRCPDLRLRTHDPEVDARRFEPVLAALEALVPEVEAVRPGLCAVRARGPARYYSGEMQAAVAIREAIVELGFPGARVGVAEGRFAAEQAARSSADDPCVEAPAPGVRLVAAADTASFLGPLPIARAAGTELGDVLRGLGIHTLGSLAALPTAAVQDRFGRAGSIARRLAAGDDPADGPLIVPRERPQDFAAELAFEPPIDGADPLAFACSTTAERFVADLVGAGLICTEISVELTDDIGVRHERNWAHPKHFDGPDVLNRVRWQAEALPRDADRAGAGVAHVRITPIRTDRAAHHEPGLWSSDSDPRVHHVLSRVQSLVGHEGVVTAQLTGGRLLRDRRRWVPWGTRTPGAETRSRPPDHPWPGALPPPHPVSVFDPPVPAECLTADGTPVAMSEDGDALTQPPSRLRIPSVGVDDPVEAWSPPWPLHERWWAGTPPRFRLQLALRNGDAWLLLHQRGSWFAEGHYD